MTTIVDAITANTLLDQITPLIEELQTKVNETAKARKEKSRMLLEVGEIESNIYKKIAFDPTLRNEQQRNAAFKIEQFRSDRWKELQDLIPDKQNQIHLLVFECRILQYQIQCYTGTVAGFTDEK